MQFQLEQRAVIAGLMPTEEQLEQQKTNSSSSSSSQPRLPTEYFWITPKEAFARRFSPKKSLPPDQRAPFAILSKGRKTLFNAEQFVEPAAIERYPINVASGRPLLSHQHADVTAWHEAHLAMLSTPEEQQLNHNKFCVFGTRTEFEEMGLKLKPDAAVVKVKAYSPSSGYLNEKFGKKEGEGEGDASQKDEKDQQQQQEPEEAWGAELKNPRDTDVVHFSLIANQDTLWERSRIVRPDDSNSSSSSATTAETSHIIVPQGNAVFPVMISRLEEYLSKQQQSGADMAPKNGKAFWVTRAMVKKLGLQLIEGAEFIQLPLYKKDNSREEFYERKNEELRKQQLEERAKETIDLIHISQCENPTEAVSRIGLHTR